MGDGRVTLAKVIFRAMSETMDGVVKTRFPSLSEVARREAPEMAGLLEE